MGDVAPAPPSRVRAALRRIRRAAMFAGATLLLCGVGLILCVNTPLGRTLIAEAINRALTGYLCGQVTLESIGSIGLSGIRGVRLSIVDPEDHQVLAVKELDAHIALVPTLRELLWSRNALEFTVSELSIGQLELNAQTDSGNRLSLQRALAICAAPSKSQKELRLAVRRMRIANLLGHVDLTSIPAFDAEFKDVAATLILIPGKLAINVSHFALATRGLANGADVAGSGDFKLVLPFATPGDILARSHWAGRVYGTELSVEVQWLAGLLRLAVDAPRVPAQTVRRFWHEFPDGLDASVLAELQGTPPQFAVKARVARAQGVLDVNGQVHIGDAGQAELHIVADSVDLRQVLAQAPETNLSASADVSAQLAASGLANGEFRIELPQNRVAGIAVPPASVQASFLHVPGTKSTVDARILLHENGAPAQVTCKLNSNGNDSKLSFDARMHAPRLDRVARLARFAQGNVTASAQGNLDLQRGTLNANLELEAVGLHRSGIDIGRAQVKAAMRGPLKSLRVDLGLDANQLSIGGFVVSDAHVRAHGPITNTRFVAEMRARKGVTVGLDGQLGLDDTVTIRDLNALFDPGTGAVKAHANTVRVKDGGVAIDTLRVDGLGEPVELTLAVSPLRTRLRTTAKGLDVSRLARVAQIGGYGGSLDLDADVDFAPGRVEGRVAFALRDFQAGRIRGGTALGEANLQAREFSAHLRAEYGQGNWLELQTDAIRLDGAGDKLAHWQNSRGRVGIDARGDLAELTRWLPNHIVAPRDLQGIVGLRADIAREAADSPANVTMSVHGSQLGGSFGHAGAHGVASAKAPQVSGIDAMLGLAYTASGDQTQAKLQLSDGTGVLATLDVSATAIPFRTLLTSPKEQLMRLPFTAQLQLPRRSLRSLPGGVVPERFVGDVESKLFWRGSLEYPDVGSETLVTQARIPRTLSRPVDLALTAHYDGQVVVGNLKAALDNRTVLDADLRIATQLANWLAASDGTSLPWEGSTRVRLNAFPLESVRALGNAEVSGVLNGRLGIEGLNRDAKANLRLDTQKLRVRDLMLSAGTAQVVIDGHHYDARIRLEEGKAFAEARLSGVPRWGDALVPSIDEAQPERAALSAHEFRMATLLPFTKGLLSDLDGRLHAELSAEINRREDVARLSGVATLRDGVFELAAGGGEFHNIDATLVFKPDGSMELQSMTAQGLTGRLQLTARTRFDGFGWASTEAHLRMPANGPIPLTLQGAGYGTMFGQVDVLAVRAPNRRDVLMDVDVPSLNVMLPDTNARTVQSLQPMQGLRLGARKAGGVFETLPSRRRGNRSAAETTEPAAQVRLNLNLGKEVKVAREGSLEVTLTGHPQIVLTDSTSVTGQLQLLRGFLDIEGKRFEIEQGTVSFVGDDPTNPQADVTATWTAPDGTVVYAEFSGPLRNGKVTLRSDPPLAKNEILALMVFGGAARSASSSASQVQASGSNVIGVAQGAATQPINHALQDYGLGGVSTRIDTSNINPRPEVEVQVARDIAIQIAWVLGTPPPGSNPDRTLFTIDWQFFRRWALETTVGDAGTSIADVVWQYGY